MLAQTMVFVFRGLGSTNHLRTSLFAHVPFRSRQFIQYQNKTIQMLRSTVAGVRGAVGSVSQCSVKWGVGHGALSGSARPTASAPASKPSCSSCSIPSSSSFSSHLSSAHTRGRAALGHAASERALIIRRGWSAAAASGIRRGGAVPSRAMFSTTRQTQSGDFFNEAEITTTVRECVASSLGRAPCTPPPSRRHLTLSSFLPFLSSPPSIFLPFLFSLHLPVLSLQLHGWVHGSTIIITRSCRCTIWSLLKRGRTFLTLLGLTLPLHANTRLRSWTKTTKRCAGWTRCSRTFKSTNWRCRSCVSAPTLRCTPTTMLP